MSLAVRGRANQSMEIDTVVVPMDTGSRIAQFWTKSWLQKEKGAWRREERRATEADGRRELGRARACRTTSGARERRKGRGLRKEDTLL